MIYMFKVTVDAEITSDVIGASIGTNKLFNESYFYTTDFRQIKSLYKIIKVLNNDIPNWGFFYHSKEVQNGAHVWFRKKF